jgi:hypothetical protein
MRKYNAQNKTQLNYSVCNMIISKFVFTSVIVRQLVFSMYTHVCVCVFFLKQLSFINSKGERLAEKASCLSWHRNSLMPSSVFG